MTAEVISWLSLQYATDGKGTRPWASRVLINYKYKGRGPYILIFEENEEIKFPITVLETKAAANCIVIAEVNKGDGSGAVDISETAEMLSGPDGRWHGRRPADIDPRLFYPDIVEQDEIYLCFADGDEITIQF